MFGYKRLDRMYEIISTSPFTSADRLSKLFGVTSRTVRSDIAKINTRIASHGARITMRRGAGYGLEVFDAKLYGMFESNPNSGLKTGIDLSSANDRLRFLLLALLNGKRFQSYDELANTVHIGEKTLQNYMRQIRELLSEYDLGLLVRTNAGAKVLGREADKRLCYMDRVIERNMQSYVKGFSDEECRLFPVIDLHRLEEVVRYHVALAEILFTDYGFKNLLVHIALMISRIEAGFELELGASTEFPPRICLFIDEVCTELEKVFCIMINQAERQYLYVHLLSNTSLDGPDINRQLLQRDVEAMLSLVSQNYGFDLQDDVELKSNLIDHLSTTFRTKNLHIFNRNPLLNTIRTNFPLAYEIALVSTLRIFKTDPYTLSEDDVGYIALHLGAAMERKIPQDHELWRIIIVCGSARSIVEMLKSRLETLFGDKLEIADAISFRRFSSLTAKDLAQFAFVVSTVPLEKSPVPSILVDFNLNRQDTEAVSRMLNALGTGRKSKIEEFFDPTLFDRIKQSCTKTGVLELLCHRLDQAGFVDREFLPSVLAREELADTNLNSIFAIPHSMKPISRKTKVAVAVLREPLAWNQSSRSVRIVFLFAVRPGDRVNIEHLYDLLIEITSSRRMQQEILAAETFEEFIDAISHRSVQTA